MTSTTATTSSVWDVRWAGDSHCPSTRRATTAMTAATKQAPSTTIPNRLWIGVQFTPRFYDPADPRLDLSAIAWRARSASSERFAGGGDVRRRRERRSRRPPAAPTTLESRAYEPGRQSVRPADEPMRQVCG